MPICKINLILLIYFRWYCLVIFIIIKDLFIWKWYCNIQLVFQVISFLSNCFGFILYAYIDGTESNEWFFKFLFYVGNSNTRVVTEISFHQCPNEKCGRKFKQQRSLTAHLKYECGVAPQFHCVVCNKSFKQRFTYKTHMFNVHQKAITI